MTNKELILDSLINDDEAFTQIAKYFALVAGVKISTSEIQQLLSELLNDGYIKINYDWKNEHGEYPYSLTQKGREAWKEINDRNLENSECMRNNKTSIDKGSTVYTRMIYMFDKEIRLKRGWGGLILTISFWLLLIGLLFLFFFNIKNLHKNINTYIFAFCYLLCLSLIIYLTFRSIKKFIMFHEKIYFSENAIKICGYQNPVIEISKSIITDVSIIKIVLMGSRGCGMQECNAICFSLNGAKPIYGRAVHLKYNKNRNYIFIQVRAEIKDIILDELGIDISEYIPNDKKRRSCKESQKP